MRKFVAKLEIPALYSDNPQVKWYNRDRSWSEEMPITPAIKKIMGLDKDAYFEITMTDQKIIAMKRLEDQKWELDGKKAD